MDIEQFQSSPVTFGPEMRGTSGADDDKLTSVTSGLEFWEFWQVQDLLFFMTSLTCY